MKHSFPPHFDKNPIVAYQSFLESSEVMEDVDDSKVADVMITLDSLRNNMVNVCIYFMHQVQIQLIMLPLAKSILYLIQITTLHQVLLEFHTHLIIQILDHG